ncbi:MAG: FtsW/RodA/SpoVE family cell cycle protein [Candidatus Promineifilaceae bacterium]|nr:FtsW/RodA/SpoVE family cell cycle protein [Candidatus Promineifilaceae bacterium]
MAAVGERRGRQERLLLGLAALFIFTNALALSIALEGRLQWTHLWAPAGWLLLMTIAHLLLQRLLPQRDPLLLPLFALLSGWGLILIDRLAPNFLWRQSLWLLLGTAAMLAIAVFPRNLRWLRRYRYTWLTVGLLLLVATLLFGVNPSGIGATLWLPAPFVDRVYFQPSELLKLLLIVFLASYFDEQERIARLRQTQPPSTNLAGRIASHAAFLAPLLLMWGFSILLLVWQRDLGAATLFFISFLALLYLATGRWLYVAGGLLLLILAGLLGYFTFDVVQLRIDAWWNPWPDATDRAFQIVQSLYAISAGGVLGQGVGQGFPIYVPVVHSDFTFAAIAEEWGLVGSLGVLACFALLGHRGLRIAARARRSFNAYLAAGITILFAAQAFLIMAGVTKLLPLTGVTLPFVSYGGSSLLISSVMMGLLIYLSQRGLHHGRPGY